MEKFVIHGGAPLSGEVTVAGNKNAALPILAACLLTEEEVLLHRVPRIRDTEAQIALLEQLGVEVAWVGDNSVRLCAAGVTAPVVDEELSSQIRASFLLAGPLLARFGAAKMPPPGGDFIGRRRLDAHLDAFKDLGARVDGSRWIELSAPTGPLRLRDLHGRALGDGHRERPDGGRADPGQTQISNAASEPHVQDLARLLTAMGAEVEGVGSNVMVVNGQPRSAAPSSRSAPTTSKSAASWRWPRRPGESCGSATRARKTSATCAASSAASGSTPRSRGRT